jgi:hypothetical protein
MIAAHGLAYLLVRTSLRLTFRNWLGIQLAVVLAVVPWLGRYLDHGTDYPLPRYPLRFLLAVPLEYIGGNSLVLLGCAAIIALGLLHREPAGGLSLIPRRLAVLDPVENLVYLTWAGVPPILMYLYSYLSQPIFGPPRYHLFIAPAYLVLVAHGLTRLPAAVRWPAAATGLVLALSLLQVYRPTLKADWRGLAAWLNPQQTKEQPEPITVVVHPSDPRFPREQLEAARYYLSPPIRVVLAGENTGLTETGHHPVYDVDCLTRPLQPGESQPGTQVFYGLIVRKQ